jgi:hypothetical protein
MTLYINEIFAQANAMETDELRLAFLRKHNTDQLQKVLVYCYHPEIKFDTDWPASIRYNLKPLGLCESSLYVEARKLYLFCTTKELRPGLKTKLLLEMCEAMHPDEARIVMSVVKKDLTTLYPTITKEIAEKLYPAVMNYRIPKAKA